LGLSACRVWENLVEEVAEIFLSAALFSLFFFFVRLEHDSVGDLGFWSKVCRPQ
jgi:hypothetical protein